MNRTNAVTSRLRPAASQILQAGMRSGENLDKPPDDSALKSAPQPEPSGSKGYQKHDAANAPAQKPEDFLLSEEEAGEAHHKLKRDWEKRGSPQDNLLGLMFRIGEASKSDPEWATKHPELIDALERLSTTLPFQSALATAESWASSGAVQSMLAAETLASWKAIEESALKILRSDPGLLTGAWASIGELEQKQAAEYLKWITGFERDSASEAAYRVAAQIAREAFIKALKQRGLSPRRVLEGNHKVDGGISTAQALLDQEPLPTAIMCSNDLTAIGVMSALRDAGLRVPEDISVVGFDNIDFARIAFPPLTTVNLSRDQLGRLAFEALQSIMKTKKRRGAEYVVETELVTRKSTAHAPEHIVRVQRPDFHGDRQTLAAQEN